MTSGIPFSKEEIEYVKAHSEKEFPSIIARGLAIKFRNYNGGSRNPKAVALLMKKLRQPVDTPQEPELKTKRGRKKSAKIPYL